MIRRQGDSSVDRAPPASYQMLSSTEFEGRLVELAKQGRETSELLDPLVISTRLPPRNGYPAFQLDVRLNRASFLELRRLYSVRRVSETYLWDFLRTVHTPLECMTGVDFLLGFHTPAIAAMCNLERVEHFLDLAEVDIWAVLQ